MRIVGYLLSTIGGLVAAGSLLALLLCSFAYRPGCSFAFIGIPVPLMIGIFIFVLGVGMAVSGPSVVNIGKSNSPEDR